MGAAAKKCRCLPAKETRAIFGRTQRAAYNEASHGWFFWNWKDGNGPDWDWRSGCGYEQGSLTAAQPSTLAPPPACSASSDMVFKGSMVDTLPKLPLTTLPLPSQMQARMSRRKQSVHGKVKARQGVERCCGRAKIRVCRLKMAALLARAGALAKSPRQVCRLPALAAADVETTLRRGLSRKASRTSLEDGAAELGLEFDRPLSKKARRSCGAGFGFKGCQVLAPCQRCMDTRPSEGTTAIVVAA